MQQKIYNEKDISQKGLEQIGLFKDGKLQISPADLDAMLSGRRTEMLKLENLYFDGFHISSLNAKISLRPNADGVLEPMIHPLYRETIRPDYLTDSEAEKLEKGEAVNIEKTVKGKKLLVEFDPETNEYIVSDTENIGAPDYVNSEPLSRDQKERYRKGKEVKLEDGTVFQYAGSAAEGVRSNRIALIASIIVDGGLSFMLYHGLKALLGKKHDERAAERSKGYEQALADFEKQQFKPGLDLNKHHGRKGPGR